MAKIKICGMRTAQDISIVNELKPDYIGFILTQGYKRTISKQTAIELKTELDKSIKAVGVFVDENIENVLEYINAGVIDIVQLHGNESIEYIKKIKAPIIKVLKPNDFDKISQYEPYVDYLLLDSGAGSGKIFDWNSIPSTQKPFFLAGGLNEDNLKKAIEITNPFAVDMSSSVETNGKKDYEKIKEVINIVRSL